MTRLLPFPVRGGLTLDVVGDLPVESDLAVEIDRIWTRESRRHPHLFDGPALSVVNIAEDRLLLVRTSYRHVLAAHYDAAIAAQLKLRPLAVTGALSCPDGLVFGRRGTEVTQGRGAWELVPSGGLTSPDIEAQILDELEEEIGVSPSQAAVLSPAGLVENLDSGVIDIIVPLTTALSADRIAALHRECASGEYAELLVCPPDDGQLDGLSLLPETRAIIASRLRT